MRTMANTQKQIQLTKRKKTLSFFSVGTCVAGKAKIFRCFFSVSTARINHARTH